MLFSSRYSISSWTSNRVWIVDFFVRLLFRIGTWTSSFSFSVNASHLYTRSFDISSDSHPLENKLNNKYNDVQPPTGPPSASLAPRFSNSSRREANKRWVRSAFGCVSVRQIEDALLHGIDAHTSLQQVMSLSINIVCPFCASSNSFRRF